MINFQGPTKIPDSGYNAYAMSLEMGVELLQQQKAKMVFVGSKDADTVANNFKGFLQKTTQNASFQSAQNRKAVMAPCHYQGRLNI